MAKDAAELADLVRRDNLLKFGALNTLANDFINQCYNDVSEPQKEDVKRIFMAGISSMFSCLAFTPDCMSEEQAEIMLDNFAQELEFFIDAQAPQQLDS